MKAISELAKDALELSSNQRIMLARILLDLSEVDAAWEEEICRRMKTVEAGAAGARSFQEMFADLDRRFPT